MTDEGTAPSAQPFLADTAMALRSAPRAPREGELKIRGRIGYSIPPRYSVAGLVSDSVVVTASGLWWEITTTGAQNVNPRGFVPWDAIFCWASRPLRFARVEVQVQHSFGESVHGVLAIRGRRSDAEGLNNLASVRLPPGCDVLPLE